MAWIPFSVAAPAGEALGDDSVTYGPGIPRERDLRLLGDVTGKRVLDLGCGAGHNAIALARAGARTIGVEERADQLEHARHAIDQADVRVELHQAPLAELAFLRADTIDAVICVHTLTSVDDIGRVFRQVHRVLVPERPFVVSVPHPTFALVDPGDPEPLRIRHSAFDTSPYGADDPRHGQHTWSVGVLFTELHRAGFRVDHILEPRSVGGGGPHWSPAMEHLPAALVLRARKEGI